MARNDATTACTTNSGSDLTATSISTNPAASSASPARYGHERASRSIRRGSRPTVASVRRAATACSTEPTP